MKNALEIREGFGQMQDRERTLDTSLIRSDGGALDTNTVLEDGLSGLNSNAIVGGVTVLHSEVIVLDIDVQVREDEL